MEAPNHGSRSLSFFFFGGEYSRTDMAAGPSFRWPGNSTKSQEAVNRLVLWFGRRFGAACSLLAAGSRTADMLPSDSSSGDW